MRDDLPVHKYPLKRSSFGFSAAAPLGHRDARQAMGFAWQRSRARRAREGRHGASSPGCTAVAMRILYAVSSRLACFAGRG